MCACGWLAVDFVRLPGELLTDLRAVMGTFATGTPLERESFGG